MKRFFVKAIEIYQRFFSLLLSTYFGINCRFYPSCSEYTKQAIHEFGLTKGILLGLKRFLRCHPLSSGGYDPLPKNLCSRR